MKLFIAAVLLVFLSVSSSNAKPTPLGSACPNLVNCFVDPCRFSRCDAYPNAKCVSNYCGGCNALWYLGEQLIDDCSSPIAKRAVKPVGEKCHTVNCFVDPCAVTRCAKHPEAVCRSNYCGGCNAWFYLGEERVHCN